MSRREEKGFPGGSLVKNPLANARERRIDPWVGKISWNRKPHSSVLAWKIPWAEGPGRLLFMGPQRVGPYWATEHAY